jgi:UDP-glucose 4-epimerase
VKPITPMTRWVEEILTIEGGYEVRAWADCGNGAHLVLGASGFIGRHLVLALASAGIPVVAASRTGNSGIFPAEFSGLIRSIRFDLADSDWDLLIKNIDVLHHLAWTSIPATAHTDPAGDLQINVGATIRMLEAVRRRKEPPRVVFCSSGGTVYGRLERVPVVEDHPVAPISAYGAAKAATELYLSQYRALYGIDCRVGRVSNPFGAGQDLARGQGAASVFVHKALSDEPIVMWGDGEVVRDYIHVSDVAAGLMALGCAPPHGQWKFNISSGQGISLNGIVHEIESRLGRPVQVERKPARKFDVPISVLDCTLAKTVLGWSPRLSFSEGIQKTISDFERRTSLSSIESSRDEQRFAAPRLV